MVGYFAKSAPYYSASDGNQINKSFTHCLKTEVALLVYLKSAARQIYVAETL